ncbi:SLC13 family permease [Mammaliicoccus sp. Dog046]|uniref:SLC13 family permease n=1 Tax=Mammaliicoccus sp. Dog046 TaxID=3034233 RepID=UPI002B25E29C|nr:SLC13 family permease [Mammaliicoccus sp. Dog046]WQK84530.1 SLC13 family permease [Mammaliicoccus sp. Dog046]
MTNRQILYLCLYLAFAIYIFLYTEMAYLGQLSLIIFVLSLGLFLFTKLPAGLAGLIALIIGILFGLPEDVLFASFNEHVVWLMIGAFIIGASVEISGLHERLIHWIEIKCNSEKKMNMFLFLLIQIISVTVPSTSGRAAAMLPIYNAFATKYRHNQTYFALLLPILILIGANLTLIGAGSHIVGIGLLEGQTKETISYSAFLIWGLPFGLIMGLISLYVIKKMYFEHNSAEQANGNVNTSYEKKPFSIKEKKTLIYISVTVLLWMTENIHGFGIAFITMAMSVIMMLPNIGVLTWKQGLKSVSWSLILFVASATALGELLVKYKVVDAIQEQLLSRLSQFQNMSELVILIVIVVITVTSHLYVTSHTTRAIVFVPLFLLFSETFHLNPVAVVFITLIGTNYCVTFPVSSKALLLFYEQQGNPFKNKDLAKVSCVLMPIYMLLMIGCYYFWWQHTGISLR